MKLNRVIAISVCALAPALSGLAAAKGLDTAPFWSAKTTAASFAQLQDQRLAHARAIVDKMIAAQGKRSVENTLRPYDDALLELDAVSSQADLMANVHPDSAFRAAAELAGQKAEALSTEYSLNRGLYDALAAIDLTGADAETRYYATSARASGPLLPAARRSSTGSPRTTSSGTSRGRTGRSRSPPTIRTRSPSSPTRRTRTCASGCTWSTTIARTRPTSRRSST